jgi:PEGA domain/Tetratricopeptide repeat
MRVGRYLAAVACVAAMSSPREAAAQATRAPSSDELDRARALDQQGVRAFREGRYNDAIRYFEEALKLGGPSSELWNIAKCQVKLDQPEVAQGTFERYLARNDLSADDRAGARRELDELGHRRSTVTIASSPTGAFVAIDGKRIGRTPISTDVAAGEHTIAVQREGFPPHIERVTARYGRAIIVDALLPGGTSGGPVSYETEPIVARRWFTGSAEAAGLFARLGSVGRPLYPAALVSLAYLAHDGPKVDVAVGARLTITNLTCGADGDVVVATFADAALGYRPSPRWRVGGDLGFGFADLPSAIAACAASSGLVAAGHAGADVSYSLTPALRLVLSPIVFEVQPAFKGGTGVWVRVGGGVGLAVDL